MRQKKIHVKVGDQVKIISGFYKNEIGENLVSLFSVAYLQRNEEKRREKKRGEERRG